MISEAELKKQKELERKALLSRIYRAQLQCADLEVAAQELCVAAHEANNKLEDLYREFDELREQARGWQEWESEKEHIERGAARSAAVMKANLEKKEVKK